MSRYSTDYAYIERAYGRHFEKGQRIRFDEDGRVGVVVKCRPSSAHYVNVVFDGENHKSLCHPMSVSILEPSRLIGMDLASKPDRTILTHLASGVSIELLRGEGMESALARLNTMVENIRATS